MRFTWFEAKATENLKKHKVSFAEAATAFGDLAAIIDADDAHSTLEESRYLLLGKSFFVLDTGKLSRLLVVVHCVRSMDSEEEIIRIISARMAEPEEKAEYISRGGLP